MSSVPADTVLATTVWYLLMSWLKYVLENVGLTPRPSNLERLPLGQKCIYANDTWPPCDDSPELCFTTFQFQALSDLVGDNTSLRVFSWDDLLTGAAQGTLPAFCYVEPAWYVPYLGNGTDYHPPANLALPVKPGDKQRRLNGLEKSMAGFWAYKITGGKRGSPEHLELTARIAGAKTVAEMEKIVYAAVEEKRARSDG
jgi:hypothetical protein